VKRPSLPVFGDQPDNAAWIAASRVGRVLPKSGDGEELAMIMDEMLRQRDFYKSNIREFWAMQTLLLGNDTHAARAANLIEYMQRNGADNALQRRVPPVWLPYARGEAAITASIAIYIWLLGHVVFCYMLLRCCDCRRKKQKQD